MGITRRQFLRGSAGIVAAGAVAPSVLASSRASLAGRALVVIELNGGNDAFNTVIPLNRRAYYDQRPTLAITPAESLSLNGATGLHPAMPELRELFGRGELAIVQGVGHPEATGSHFRNLEIWHRGCLDAHCGSGWLGRYRLVSPGAALDMPWMCFGGPVPGMFHTDALACPVVVAGRELDGQAGCHHTVPSAASEQLGLPAPQRPLRLPRAAYPQDRLGTGLCEFAGWIAQGRGGVYYISQAGFDTHARQAEGHAQLLRSFSAGLGAFLEDLRAEGLHESVLVMVISEFGRRLRENSSAGTDHGSVGMMCLAGSALNGGLYGEYPDLDRSDDGAVRCTVDFRDCYATVLERWLGVEAERVLPGCRGRLAFL